MEMATTATATTVLCCMCGIPIAPNTVNTCATCLASKTDITRGISTEATLHQCRGCQRWHKEAGKWVSCELESRELMALCLAHVSGLRTASKSNSGQNKIRLVDAGWIWTEPHSMRLKVRLTIQREVQAGTILQQSFTVLFVVRNQQCIECQSVFRQGSWKSLVQVRQRVSHKRTFLYLEQLILKHGAHRGCLSIKTFKDGMDFYFPDKGKAARFISFLENACPIKVKTSKKLIGTDDKSNISNFKYTSLVEICPLCKDDLVYLPAKTARALGDIARLVLVKCISNVIHFIDPCSGQIASMTSEAFWRDPIRPLVTAARSRFTRYVVLSKEPVFLRQNAAKRRTNRKQKSRLANVIMAREDDLGANDRQWEERSHIGYLLKAGDVCVGYDLQETQFVDDEAEAMRAGGDIPSVVLVRKLYGVAATGESDKSKRRIWSLQRLDVAAADADESENPKGSKGKRRRAGGVEAMEEDEMDEEDFMQEVEADRDMRLNINLYKSEQARQMTASKEGGEEDEEDDDEDDQKVTLDELLDGLALDSGPDGNRVVDGNVVGDDKNDEFASMLLEGEKATKDGIAYVSREEARRVKDKDAAVPVSGGALEKDFRR